MKVLLKNEAKKLVKQVTRECFHITNIQNSIYICKDVFLDDFLVFVFKVENKHGVGSVSVKMIQSTIEFSDSLFNAVEAEAFKAVRKGDKVIKAFLKTKSFQLDKVSKKTKTKVKPKSGKRKSKVIRAGATSKETKKPVPPETSSESEVTM